MIKYLATVIFTLIFSNIFAQNMDWQSITNMNDVQDAAVYNEQLVVVSKGGAYIYDPENESLQKFTNTEGLKSVDLVEVEVDNYGNILFGSSKGHIQQYNPVNDLWYDIEFDGSVLNDFKIKEDTLWVASGSAVAVFLWVHNQWQFSDAFFNFPEIIDAVNDIELYDNHVWLATNSGVLSAPSDFSSYALTDPQNWTLQTTSDGLKSNTILALSSYNGKLWIGTGSGLQYFQNNILTNFDLLSREINILHAAENQLHIASGGSYYNYNGSTLSAQRNYSARINTLVIDTSSILWIGLAARGLQNAQSNKIIAMDGPQKNNVRYIIKDTYGRIWASAGKYKIIRNEGYSVFENGYWTGHTFNGSRFYDLGNTGVIYQDSYSNIWFGSWGGGIQIFRNDAYVYLHNHPNPGTRILTTFDTTYSQEISPIEEKYTGLLSNAPNNLEDYIVVTAFKEDPSGNMWIANSHSGNGNYLAVAPYKDGFIDVNADWVYFGTSDNISFGTGIPALEVDDFGRIWIAAQDKGVYILDYNNTIANKLDDQLFLLDISDDLFSTSINTLAKDNDGIMWIGSNAGLNSFDGANVYRHIGDEQGVDGPINNAINQIVVDKFNNKWVATSGGLSILKDGKSAFEPGAWISYNTDNSGLIDNFIYSVYVDSKTSETLLGTDNGISVFKGSFAEIKDNYSEVTGGPNPFVLSENNFFTIKYLKAYSSVKIFNINGTLIQTLTSDNAGVEGSRAYWNGRDLNEKKVPVGIYLYLAYTESGKSISGKIAVINK